MEHAVRLRALLFMRYGEAAIPTWWIITEWIVSVNW